MNKIRKYFILFSAAAIVLVMAVGSRQVKAASEVIKLTPIEDSSVKQSYSSSNYGDDDRLIASDYGSNDRRAFLKFDLSSISGKKITAASLKFTATLSRTVSKDIYFVSNNNWSEDTLTYDNAPALNFTLGQFRSSVSNGDLVSVDLDTNSLQDINGFLTVAVMNDGGGNTFEFSSKESDSGQPQLWLTIEDGATSSIPGDANGDRKVDGQDFTIWLSHFGQNTRNGYSDGDFNLDQNVDGIDFSIWLNNYDKETSTPTPTATATATSTSTATATATATSRPTSTPTSTPTATPRPTATPPSPTPNPDGKWSAQQLDPDANCAAQYDDYDRIFLESQAWWWLSNKTDRVQTGDDFGHIHVGTCFPFAEEISGVVPFRFRIVMHNNPGVVTSFHGSPAGTNAGFNVPEAKGISCPGTETCVFYFDTEVDTTKSSVDGRREWRIHVHMEQPDGNSVFPTQGWQTYLSNGGGRPVRHDRDRDIAIARGWYNGAEYQNVSIYPLPKGPVSGDWTFNWRAAPGSGGTPTTYHMLAVDFKAHADPMYEGWVIREGKGEFRGDVTIDTTKLENGWHRLFMRADSDIFNNTHCITNEGKLCDSTNSGVQVFWFNVQN